MTLLPITTVPRLYEDQTLQVIEGLIGGAPYDQASDPFASVLIDPADWSSLYKAPRVLTPGITAERASALARAVTSDKTLLSVILPRAKSMERACRGLGPIEVVYFPDALGILHQGGGTLLEDDTIRSATARMCLVTRDIHCPKDLVRRNDPFERTVRRWLDHLHAASVCCEGLKLPRVEQLWRQTNRRRARRHAQPEGGLSDPALRSTQWTNHFSKEPARLSALPLTGPLPHTPHLVQPESARPGDLIGVFGGIHNSTGQSFNTLSTIEVAYQQGALEPEVIFDDQLSVFNAAAFREITAVPFAGLNHHRIVHQARMVEKWTPYTIHLVQFADALLYVHPHWIHGIWGWREDHSELCPLVILMESAKSREEGERCIEKAMRYIGLFHSLLPQYERASVHMNIERPRPEDFFCHDAEHDSVVL